MVVANVKKFELTSKEMEMVEEVLRLTNVLFAEDVFECEPFNNYYSQDIVDYLESLMEYSGRNLY
jgi:hypothetical protein